MNGGIMLQGTASNVGKSAVATALCRILKQDGINVAPFKGWNMALNSYVTRDGGEIGRAQGEQAMACGIHASVDMNPVLVKPKGDGEAQVIIRGRPWLDRRIGEKEGEYRRKCTEAIEISLENLWQQYDVLVIEGAGSPAEINLRDNDLANMLVARMADVPVLLVADIDRGGALASVVGTMMLLLPEDRKRVAGFIFNMFRGDFSILEPGLRMVEDRTGIPVVGVIPYLRGLNLAAEDGVSLEDARHSQGFAGDRDIQITVINLPRISNFTDFDALKEEPGVYLKYIRPGEEIGQTDAVIIPGSKNSVADLVHLIETGCAGQIVSAFQRGVPVVGICGGYQMLGMELKDPLNTESSHGSVTGMGLLHTITSFHPEKQTFQVKAQVKEALSRLLPDLEGEVLTGYEIHMGCTELLDEEQAAVMIKERSGSGVSISDGAVGKKGFVFGTYLHGIFDNENFRRSFVKYLYQNKGLVSSLQEGLTFSQRINQTYDTLADVVRENIDVEYIKKICGVTA